MVLVSGVVVFPAIDEDVILDPDCDSCRRSQVHSSWLRFETAQERRDTLYASKAMSNLPGVDRSFDLTMCLSTRQEMKDRRS